MLKYKRKNNSCKSKRQKNICNCSSLVHISQKLHFYFNLETNNLFYVYSIFTICWRKNNLIFQFRVKKLSQFLSVVIDLSGFRYATINRIGITITSRLRNLKYVCNFIQLERLEIRGYHHCHRFRPGSFVRLQLPPTNICDISI